MRRPMMPDAAFPPQADAAPVVAQGPVSTPAGSPQAVYRALVSQREILGNQLSDAQRLRENLVGQLSESNQTPATRASLEKRIANADARIADLDKQIAQSDVTVAQAAAVPGAAVRPPQPPRNGPPDEAYALGALFMFIVLLPMSIAFARRVWRRSARAEVTLPPEMSERMAHLERGVEAIAIEVERIGEGQRFVTQVLTERGDLHARALGAGAAEPIPLRQKEQVEERR